MVLDAGFRWNEPQVHRADCLQLSACALTIGAFDGVHRGHQALILSMIDSARRRGLPAVVYTFDPPPKVFFGSAKPLIPYREKIARLSALGPDHIIVASFDESYRRRSAMAFIDELARLKPQTVWIGKDFHFGSGKDGNRDLLARFFTVRTFGPVHCADGEVISSTRIRRLRDLGDTRAAAALQGWRDFDLAKAEVRT